MKALKESYFKASVHVPRVSDSRYAPAGVAGVGPRVCAQSCSGRQDAVQRVLRGYRSTHAPELMLRWLPLNANCGV